MHREFQTLLKDAKGASRPAIAIFADIRGFSTFSQTTESPDAAMFIKRVYQRLIEHYSFASFFKPTGDGLLIVVPFSEADLSDISGRVVNASLEAVEGFARICDGDPLINFPVPTKLGIGIARGTACQLMAGEKTLDYSGRLLNLAARLMDAARPEGVVIDESFMHSMIPETRRPLFKEERIFLKGVADTTPRRIFYLDAKVRIGSEFLRPTAPQHFHTDNYEATGADVMSLAPVFRHAMKHVPVEGFDAEILALIPKYNEGKLVAGVALHHEQKARYVMSGGSYYTELDMAQIQQVIKRANVPGDAKVKIKVTYPVAQPVRSVDEVRAAPNEPTFIESWKELVARTR